MWYIRVHALASDTDWCEAYVASMSMSMPDLALLVASEFFLPCIYGNTVTFFPSFFPAHSLSSRFFFLSLLVVTQIRGHLAGSSSPLTTTVRALHFFFREISALIFSLVHSRRILLCSMLTRVSFLRYVACGVSRSFCFHPNGQHFLPPP